MWLASQAKLDGSEFGITAQLMMQQSRKKSSLHRVDSMVDQCSFHKYTVKWLWQGSARFRTYVLLRIHQSRFQTHRLDTFLRYTGRRECFCFERQLSLATILPLYIMPSSSSVQNLCSAGHGIFELYFWVLSIPNFKHNLMLEHRL